MLAYASYSQGGRALCQPQALLGYSGMWCFRMWGWNIIVSTPSPISALGVKSQRL